MKKLRIVPLLFVGAILLILWVIETPAGLLGKADAVGYAVCHRLDLRSFHLGVRQLPLCARCTGQYIGAMIGLTFQAALFRRRSGFPAKRILPILGLLGLAYALDGINSFMHLQFLMSAFPHLPLLYEPSNAIRLMTGSGMGVVLAVIIYPAFVGTVYSKPDSRPSISGAKSILILVGLCLLADLLIISGSPIILYPAALISAAGVIILLSLAYTIVVLRIFKRENASEKFLQISLPLLTGFMLSMIQIASFDLIRFIITNTWGGFVF